MDLFYWSNIRRENASAKVKEFSKTGFSPEAVAVGEPALAFSWPIPADRSFASVQWRPFGSRLGRAEHPGSLK